MWVSTSKKTSWQVGDSRSGQGYQEGKGSTLVPASVACFWDKHLSAASFVCQAGPDGK